MESLCTQVYNRNSFLEQALPTWLSRDFSEIVIVNWYTEDKFPLHNDPRIKLVRVLEDLPYSLSIARNLSFRAATHNTIFYIDCDIKLTDKFPAIKDIEISEDFFYMGVTDTINPVNGSMICTKKQFDSINGHDERLVDYGHEDINFSDRLRARGYEKRYMPEGLEHIFHTNVFRALNFKEKDIFLSTYKNILRTVDKPWTDKDEQRRVKVMIETTEGTCEKIL